MEWSNAQRAEVAAIQAKQEALCIQQNGGSARDLILKSLFGKRDAAPSEPPRDGAPIFTLASFPQRESDFIGSAEQLIAEMQRAIALCNEKGEAEPWVRMGDKAMCRIDIIAQAREDGSLCCELRLVSIED